ncbi:MAG TPA: F0F1 ATP synthase subunit B' [Alphaproteobacteria bacterium]|nr:F0F1 ATP synthase subunit B' [Alphaproteobacteria bacterium]
MRRVTCLRNGLALGIFGSALPAALAFAAEKGSTQKSGMPQLDPSSFASQIFWLALTFTLFFLIAWRVALPRIGRVLEDRRERIDRDVAKAQEVRNEAEAVLAEYEKLSAEGRASAQVVIREANELAAAEASAAHEKLSRRLAGDIEKAERRIAEARNSALEGIGDIAAEIAQAASAKLIGLEVSPQDAAGAVSRAVKDLG